MVGEVNQSTGYCEQNGQVGGEGELKQKTTVPLGNVGGIGGAKTQDNLITQ